MDKHSDLDSDNPDSPEPLRSPDNPADANPEGDDSRGRRRSSREKREVKRFSSSVERKCRLKSDWTRPEKIQLLDALKQVGEYDTAALERLIPTKTSRQIIMYIKKLKQRSELSLVRSGTEGLEQWLEVLEPLAARTEERHSFDPLPITHLLISLFEDLPGRDHPSGIDFRALYQTIFCALSELPVPELNSTSQFFLYKTLVELQERMREAGVDLREEVSSASIPDEWPFSSTDMNPLGFPKVTINMDESDDT